MEKAPVRITVNTQKIILSSLRSVYKTESFVFQTRKISSSDTLVSAIAGGIFASGFSPSPSDNTFIAETEDKFFTLFFKMGDKSDNPSVTADDVIFFKFLSKDKSDRTNDKRVLNYLDRNKVFTVILRSAKDSHDDEDLSKIYILSENDRVNFPLLNDVQRSIVETENSNMLVQGVAGSGKTNVCIEKIVRCACRNYKGKILYTTFSRGLLIETKNRVTVMKDSIKKFIESYENNDVVFLDKNHKKAVENKFGLIFDFDEDKYLIDVLKRVSSFLEEKVDYLLIEDLYARSFDKKEVFGETDFLEIYLPDATKRLSGVLDKLKNLSSEIIYKEIYGMIFGKFDPNAPSDMMERSSFLSERSASFTGAECEALYTVATDYKKFFIKNDLQDNNSMSRKLMEVHSTFAYSVGIIDEVQDFTQVNLCLMKKLCLKMFAVGDALQMINPSYFGFAYLKRLMYGDVTGVTELKHNYRNSPGIQKIVNKLGDMNVKRFGTHSFVLKGTDVFSSAPSATVFIKDKGFLDSLTENRYSDVTIIVSGKKRKDELRKKLKKTEILTIAEAKGLERTTVVLADVLTDDKDKWHYLSEMSLNRKTADENSVFRYYFNLFYVGVSRAKQYLFVYEENNPPFFDEFFKEYFETEHKDSALSRLAKIAGTIELDDDELTERIRKFCELGQYENAYFTADRLSDDIVREEELGRIFVSENFISHGNYRDAGVEFWKRGMDEDAKKMFRVSGDEKLIPLIDACRGNGKSLDVDIVRFIPLVMDNDIAVKIINGTLQSDYNTLMGTQKSINEALKAQRSKK